jgi:glycosyltransferase involved in cell wall biosynthesis
MHPTLSVVMPNYNHVRFVEGALEAIAAQSFDSVEIVVVDDHSTDNSLDVI